MHGGQKHASDSGQTFPRSEYLAPDSGDIYAQGVEMCLRFRADFHEVGIPCPRFGGHLCTGVETCPRFRADFHEVGISCPRFRADLCPVCIDVPQVSGRLLHARSDMYEISDILLHFWSTML